MRIKSSKTVFECPIFKVDERQVILDSGIERTYWYTVRQPAVAVVALTNDKKIILQKERVGMHQDEKLCLPAGKMDSHTPTAEELQQQALEELHEEAGYRATNIELLFVKDAVSNTLERKYYKYVAWNLEHVGQKLEPGETITPFLVSPEEAERLATSGEMTFPEEREAVIKALQFFKDKGLL